MNFMRVVLDLNLFVSALIGKTATRAILDHWRTQQFVLVLSERLLAELRAVLARPKFQRYFTVDDVQVLIALLEEHAEFVEPTIRLELSRDAKDNILLDVAATAHANYLVTGDKDLLDDPVLIKTMLEQYGVQVIPANTFLEILARESE
ncbi:MAG: putative toxin-antitoxin system toxin component, PIN family [Chloroflexota bacterium]|nr:MAG: putative toxin-antitoxin system toxin component, PIN family [Chloroflexota bacterium]